MELDFNKITRLEKIRVEKSELSREENALISPVLKDNRLVRVVHGIFTGILNERGSPPGVDSVLTRKKFIFIILYLFSPGTLAGGKIKAGLREEMSRVLGIQSKTVISNNLDDIMFLYRNYKDFREDTGHLYTGILERLKARGLVK